MKTLIKNHQRKNQQQQQRKSNKHHQKLKQLESETCAATAVEQEEPVEQLSEYESYYQQLTEEVESVERHARELRQTPGLEHLTEAKALEQVDFMLRFTAWVFNQHLEGQLVATMAEADEVDTVAHESSNAAKGKSRKVRITKK